MLRVLLLAPVVLMAQTTTPPKPPAKTASPGAKPAAGRPAAAKPKPSATKPSAAGPVAHTMTTDEEKTIYALGLSIAGSLAPFDLSPHELELVQQALKDAAAGKPAVELKTWGPKIEALAQTRSGHVAERQKATSKAYLEKAAGGPGAVKTNSGMVYRELRAGSGPSPLATDTVKVNYRGTLINGVEFDSSYSRHEPAQFALNGVIRCWTEGVQKMKVGGKAMLVCPSDLAYGDQGRPSIPGGAALIFEIELLEVVGKPTP
jgi:FKBP-type peptidyl-prolyl cis-trans isomerase FkpA